MTDTLSVFWPPLLLEKAGLVLALAREKSVLLATAESCTGGLLAGLLTEIPGSSASFGRGLVTYSNEAKIDLLGVGADLLNRFGAVSAEVALAMAEGACRTSGADIAVAITGIAGPGGGSAEKPVGLVWIACWCAHKRKPPLVINLECGTLARSEIRGRACNGALDLLLRTFEEFDQPDPVFLDHTRPQHGPQTQKTGDAE